MILVKITQKYIKSIMIFYAFIFYIQSVYNFSLFIIHDLDLFFFTMSMIFAGSSFIALFFFKNIKKIHDLID